MAVSPEYLTKIRIAVRRSQNDEIDQELTDLIEECRLDLQQLGVLQAKVEDESDPLILGAIRCFVRWRFGLSNVDGELNREDYYTLRDELRKRIDYITEDEGE